jgi:DNA-binding response OmpR family regulator
MPYAIGAVRTATSESDRSKKVLVCDDERHIVRLIQVNLERQGYVVDTASTGAEALQKMRADPPALLVLDYDLPDMSTEEILAAMRADERLQDVRVILLKPRDSKDPSDTPPGVHVFYLTKPADPKRIMELLSLTS